MILYISATVHFENGNVEVFNNKNCFWKVGAGEIDSMDAALVSKIFKGKISKMEIALGIVSNGIFEILNEKTFKFETKEIFFNA